MESSEKSVHSTGPHRFQPGNKYGRGGKRPNAGRKTKKERELIVKQEQTALEIYKAEQQRQARAVVSTYYKLAKSGKHPSVTVHEIDKVAPDEHNIAVAPSTINFIQYNVSSPISEHSTDTSTGNPSPIINVTPQPVPIVAPSIILPASFIKDKD